MKSLVVAQVHSAIFECATRAFISAFKKHAFDVVVEKLVVNC